MLRTLVPFTGVPWHAALKNGRGFPTVGEKRDFWTYDLSVMPPKNASVPSTCRGVGERSAIWVADDQWGTKVTQQDVDDLLSALETGTPRLPDKGIVQGNEELFGAPPLFAEGDPDVTILVYDIAGYKQYTFDGFFRREDLDPFNPSCKTNPMIYCSNELGMIHVTSKDVGSEYMQGVIAHEYEHLAHYGRDPYEESWVDESMAELAMVFGGYEDPGNLADYGNKPWSSLVVEPPVHYGACFLFGAYLHQRLGSAAINAFVADTKHGVDGVEAHTAAIGAFPFLLGQWAAANILDNPDFGAGEFGYDLIDPPPFNVSDIGSSSPKNVEVFPTGAYYVKAAKALSADQVYAISLTPADADIGAYAVIPSTGEAFPLQVGGETLVPAPGVPEVIVSLANGGTATKVKLALEVTAVADPNPEGPEPEPELGAEDIVAPPDATPPEDLFTQPEQVSQQDMAISDKSGIDAHADAAAEGEKKTSSGGCSASSATPSALWLLLALLVACSRFAQVENRKSEI